MKATDSYQKATVDTLRQVMGLGPLPETHCSILDAGDTLLGRSLPLLKSTSPKSYIQPTGRSQDTQVVTVSLGFAASFNAPAPGVGVERRAPVIADVQWGVGGGSHRAEVDFHNGTQFSIPASNISIAARFLEDVADVFDQVALSVSIAWQTRAARSLVTRTLVKTTIAPGAGSAIFTVPPFAYGVMLFEDAPSPSPLTWRFLGGPATTDETQMAESVAALRSEGMLTNDGVKLPGTTRFIEITNPGGAPIGVTLVFPLNL